MSETLRVGERLPANVYLRGIPKGTEIRDPRSGYVLTRRGNGRWRVNGGGATWADSDVDPRHYEVQSLPDDAREAVVKTPTVQQVKWEFRTGALKAAHDHGVSVAEVERSLTKMGCGRQDFDQSMIGPGVLIGDPQARDALPPGSVIYSGDPELINSLSVFVKNVNGRWTNLIGERGTMENMGRWGCSRHGVPTPPALLEPN